MRRKDRRITAEECTEAAAVFAQNCEYESALRYAKRAARLEPDNEKYSKLVRRMEQDKEDYGHLPNLSQMRARWAAH